MGNKEPKRLADTCYTCGQPIDPLSTEIAELDLDVRSYNCCKNAGVRDVGGLIKCSPADVLKWKNAGRRTLQNIQAALAEYGLSLTIAER